MKARTRVILSAVMVAPVIFMGSAAAVEGSTSNNTTSTSGSDKASAQTTNSETSEDKLTLQQRLDKRKAELKTKLTTAEQARLKLKCKASQGLLSRLQGRITGIETSRANVYGELADRLTKFSTKLKGQGVDTTQLQSELEVLNTKIETFKTDLAAYKLAVSDLASMDCATDPTAFKASLTAARTAHDKVMSDSVEIKKYVNDTIKPTLVQLKQKLSSTTNTDKKSEGSNQ